MGNKVVMLKVGDLVTTDFYKKDSDLIRKVTDVKPYIGSSESGWEVTTIDHCGRFISCDMNWYLLST
jgi:hypothetical protein